MRIKRHVQGILMMAGALGLLGLGCANKDKHEDRPTTTSSSTNSMDSRGATTTDRDLGWTEPATSRSMSMPVYSRSQVRRVQEALNRETAVDLDEDGRMGPLTAAALRQFQAEEGIPVTGSINSATLQALDLGEMDSDRAPASVDDE